MTAPLRSWWPTGYDRGRPLPGGGGWEAVEAATGAPVVLRHVASVTDDWRETAARLVAFRHRRAVPVRAVLAGPAGAVVVSDAVGRPLGGARSPGEAATVTSDLAAALDAAHARGLWHGAICPDAVRIDDGAALLDGLGPGMLGGAIDDPRSADVEALRALGRDLLGAPEPRLRSRHRAPGADRHLPRLAAAVLTALALAAGGGWLWGRTDDAATGRRLAPAAAHVRTDAELTAAIGQLLARRAALLAVPDESALTSIYVDGTPLHRTETARVAALRSDDLHARGFVQTPLDITVLERRSDTAVVRLVDELTAYDVVDATEAVRRSEPARGARAWHVDLHRMPGGWRIAAVTPAWRAPSAAPAPAPGA